ncbi:hypothetical protein ACWGJQ_29110 [Peribacillus simplex]
MPTSTAANQPNGSGWVKQVDAESWTLRTVPARKESDHTSDARQLSAPSV